MKEHTESSESARRKRPTQRERRARTREQLLQAAHAVFVRRGFSAASLDEIAEIAGLSKGALYYNFAGKEDLFLALVEERLERRAADLAAGMHVARAELRRAAEQGQEADWVNAVIGRLPLDRDWTLLFFEFVCHAAREPQAAQAFAERLRALRALSARALEQLAEDARLTLPAPATELADGLSALANGAAIEALLIPDPEPARELLVRTAARILRPEAP